MPRFRTGAVVEVLEHRDGLQRVRVHLDGDDDTSRAYVLVDLVGEVAVGDDVVCNTTAVDRGLGTGGWHVVHWNLARRELDRPGPDHVMKLRYTSLQSDVGTSELRHPECPTTLEGTPVVATMVHSQVAAVAVTCRAAAPDARIVYVMTDGAALPASLSDLVVGLRRDGMLDGVVTAGHAFGGDLEAVTVPSALVLARHVLGADVVLVGMGPGVVGTGTPLGTTAIEAAAVLDATDALGGQPVLAVRASSGDDRDRHRGVSHHTATVLSLCHCTPHVADHPVGAPELDGCRRHEVDTGGVLDELRAVVPTLTTMGRGLDDDPEFFLTAGAAGILAAGLLDTP